MGEFYKKLKTEIEESVRVEPIDSFETIISAVAHELEDNEDVEALCDDCMEEMMDECAGMGEAMPTPMQMPVIYPILIATYPSFCLFEVGDDTYRADYQYDIRTRRVQLSKPKEVIIDLIMKDAPAENE